MNEESPFMLQEHEVTQAVDMYGELGEKTADEYKHLPLSLKRTAACVVIGVVRHMSPSEVREWSDNTEFRANADALIAAYEISHPEKIGVALTAGEFITELAARLDHSACDHGRDDAEAFHDTSARMTIPDPEMDAKFADIMAGFEDTADEPAARPASFEVRSDGETTDQRGDA